MTNGSADVFSLTEHVNVLKYFFHFIQDSESEDQKEKVCIQLQMTLFMIMCITIHHRRSSNLQDGWAKLHAAGGSE